MYDFWLHTRPGVERCRMHTQVLCLTRYAGESTARRVSGAWAALSAACHHHGYELGPTAGELRALHDEVRVLTGRLSPVPPSL
ncbi:hypothetical protein [Streptosporangium sp. NPDC002721]|uniref:hypothetical protein n=1 Tax=Streptosporangium sp. NPDC002721 TaxID=3366188 RepID=UPI003683FC47